MSQPCDPSPADALARASGRDPQRISVYSLDPANVAGDLDSQLLFGIVGNDAFERHHAIPGFDFDVQSVECAAIYKAGFHLAGDPCVAEFFSNAIGLQFALLLDRLGITRADTDEVVYLGHAVGIRGQAPCQLLGIRIFGLAFERNHALSSADVDIQSLRYAVPEQFGFDGGRQSGVIKSLGHGGFSARVGRHLRINLQLIVDFVDALNITCNLRSQILVHLVFDLALENCGALLDIDADLEWTQMAIQREGRPDRAFLTRFGQLAACAMTGASPSNPAAARARVIFFSGGMGGLQAIAKRYLWTDWSFGQTFSIEYL
jgi:hypothetical protein